MGIEKEEGRDKHDHADDTGPVYQGEEEAVHVGIWVRNIAVPLWVRKTKSADVRLRRSKDRLTDVVGRDPKPELREPSTDRKNSVSRIQEPFEIQKLAETSGAALAQAFAGRDAERDGVAHTIPNQHSSNPKASQRLT